MSIIIPNPPDLPGDGYPSSFELSVQRKITTAFISTAPAHLILTPRTQVKTGAGGFKWVDGEPRVMQIMRLTEPSISGSKITVEHGVVRDVEFELIGEWDATIGLYDTFEFDGRKWEILSLFHFNGYERRATVVRHGG